MMGRGLVLGCAVALASLTGCAAPAMVGEYPNQQGMIGRSKASVLACAGAPITEAVQDGTTLLVYYREAPVLEESSPVSKGSFPTIRHGCWATVILAEDTVREVQYRFVPAAFDAYNDCEEIFEPCVP